MRTDGRKPDETRTVEFEIDYTKYAPGSVLTRMGETVVLCTAMVEGRVPFHRKDSGGGWLSAEYAMLPSANRNRQSHYGSVSGRNIEIQRIIGRSLRAAVDLNGIGERTIWIDCDVIQADGGTRTAAVSGSFVALVCALRALRDEGKISVVPIVDGVAAVSVGIVGGEPILDLCYEEDRVADVDMNIIATHDEEIIEIQGTAEHTPFSRAQLDTLIDLALVGVRHLKSKQIEALGLTDE